jgi:hypothetical protein
MLLCAVLPNTAWMPFLASQDIKTAAGQRAQVGLSTSNFSLR